jgi:uroporphyrinogen-III decarboxylase
MFVIDYVKHNEEVAKLLAMAKEGINERVLMEISANPRMILSDPQLNTEGITFQDYMENPMTMLEVQSRFQEYQADYLVRDKKMGFAFYDGVSPYADGHNVSEANYFGGEVVYNGTGSPGAKPFLDESNKYAFIEKPFPEINCGVMGRAIDFTAFFEEAQKKGWTYKEKPIIGIGKPCMGTDGPFTVGCCLMGATDLCIALYEEPEFVRDFLGYITDATIARIKYFRRLYGESEKSENFWFADDSISLLSVNDYREHILPFHKKIIRELSYKGDRNGIHLCGNATHLFKTLVEELNIVSFDTGFPVRFGELIRELGPDIGIFGGVHVDILLRGSAGEIRAETKRILEEVKPLTRNFTIKEANNLSPCTNPESLLVMYNAVKDYGNYTTENAGWRDENHSPQK